MLIIEDIFQVSLSNASQREAHMFYLVKEIGKFGHVLAEKKGSFIIINEFKIWSNLKNLAISTVYHFTAP